MAEIKSSSIIDLLAKGDITLSKPCNLLAAIDQIDHGAFDYKEFIGDYAHEECTTLAFYLHDKFQLKIGAIRAIDQNNPDDTDYEAIVHQFVYITDSLVLDARGIDTEQAMLDYYTDVSSDDDEDWDFMIDADYQKQVDTSVKRNYEHVENTFNSFLDLLAKNLSI